MKTVPNIIKKPVMERANLLCSARRLVSFKRLTISTITLNPIPPRMIEVVIQSVTVASPAYAVRLLNPPKRSKPALLKADIEWKMPNHKPFCQPRSSDQRIERLSLIHISEP